jgi:flagellin
MIIQHNIPAMNASRYLGVNTGNLSKSLEKLASGYKINRAGDNAAGLAVSEKMRAQMSGIDQAVRNAGDGISMVQTFEGALEETHQILNRIKTLATQSANGTYTDDTDRAAIELEYNQLVQELDDIAQTDFNGVIVMAKGGTVEKGKIVQQNVHHDAKMTPGTGVIASATGLDKLAADETINVTKGEAAKAPTNARYETTITGEYEETAAREDEWRTYFTIGATNNKITFNAGATLTLRTGNTVSITAGEYTARTLSAYLASKMDDLGISSTEYDVSITFQTENETIQSFCLQFKAKDVGAKTDLALLGTPVFTGLSAISMNSSGHTTTGLDGSDGTINIFGQEITLTDGDDINDIKTHLQDALDDTGSPVAGDYTVGVSGNKLYVQAKDAGVDASKATVFVATDRNAAGLTISAVTETVVGKAAVAAIIPTITDASWVRQSDGVYKKGDTTITLGATTGAGEITLKKAYDALEDVYVPAKVNNTDTVSLQVGARTKDLKKYDFTYSQVWNSATDPSAMMASSIGSLVADVNVTAKGLGLVTSSVNLASQRNANAALDKIDNAINKVSMIRGTFGSIQNRLDHKIANLGVTNENINAAESRIRDTDMAEEMMAFTKNQIIMQSAQSMLAQANQLPMQTMQLLQ